MGLATQASGRYTVGGEDRRMSLNSANIWASTDFSRFIRISATASM
jgi:hypothetical protein